jgi:hypothetical protein
VAAIATINAPALSPRICLPTQLKLQEAELSWLFKAPIDRGFRRGLQPAAVHAVAPIGTMAV